MDSGQKLPQLDSMQAYLSSLAADAVALVQIQKVWCSPIETWEVVNPADSAHRVRLLTKAYLSDGRVAVAKLWFHQSSQQACDQWLARLLLDSCWEVFGRTVDVGHPKYQTIAVQTMQPLSINVSELFLQRLAQMD